MTNKTKNLEQEFEAEKYNHMIAMVIVALFRKSDEGIYDSPFLRGKYRDIEGTPYEKAEKIAYDLFKKDKKAFCVFYEYCWKILMEEYDDIE